MQAPPPRRTVLWDPSGSDRFIVGAGTDIKLYQWSPRSEKIKLITVQSDLMLMKCFAWAPHPSYNDLLAIGLSTGRVDLMRITANIVAPAESDNTPPKPTTYSLNLQHTRSCNSLSFNPTNPNYLAASLDRVRGQYSIMIWDIEKASQGISPRYSPSDSAWSRSLSKLSPRIAQSNESVPVRRYGSAETVTSMTFIPSDPYLLSACMGHRWLRILDIREPMEPPSSVAQSVPTKASYGLCYDPFDELKLASYGEDGGIRIWDRRRFDYPVLAFSEADAAGDGAEGGKPLNHIEFSAAQKGLFGSLEKDGHNTRLWNLMEGEPQLVERDFIPAPAPVLAPISDLDPRSRRGSAASLPEFREVLPAETTLPALGHTRIGKVFKTPLSSFAFAPSLPGTKGHAYIVTANRDGNLDISRPSLGAYHSWSPRGELAVGSGFSYRMFDEHPPPPTQHNEDPWELDIAPTLPPVHDSPIHTEPSEDRIGRLPFPAVKDSRETSVARPSSLSASRNMKQRAYSPSALRGLPPTKSDRDRSASATRGNGSTAKSTTSKAYHDLSRVLNGDISGIIRSRVMAGYGLESVVHNSNIASKYPVTTNDVLPDLWKWMEASKHLVGVEPRVYGFDFGHQGVLSVWEGFHSLSAKASLSEDRALHTEPTSLQSLNMSRTSSGRGHRRPSSRPKTAADSARQHYETAIEVMNGRRTHGIKKELPKAAVQSSRAVRRQFALSLVDWDFNDAEFAEQLTRWEEDNLSDRAACWAVFLQDTELAMQILMRSRTESLQMLSGTVEMLLAAESDVSEKGQRQPNRWRAHVERLMIRMGGMYIRAMLSRLVGNSWMDILSEEVTMPLRERLAIALFFLPDDQLNQYLRGLVDSMNRVGEIDALLITGLNPLGLDVIQAYVDNTGDVQSAAILVSSVAPGRWKSDTRPTDPRPERWIAAYQDILDGWRLFHHRVQFDMLRGEVNSAAIRDGEIEPFEWVPRQMEVRCNYCNKIVNSALPMESGLFGGAAGSAHERVRADFCPTCRRKLPRCSICLMTIGVPDDDVRYVELADAISTRDTIDDAMVFCQACRHGGHSAHILDWFLGDVQGKTHSTCAVADCECNCAEYL